MYNGIGLQTPRGSGTKSHIESNKFLVKKPKASSKDVAENNTNMKAKEEILEHERKRQIQLMKLVILEEKLVDMGYTDAEIAKKLQEARNELEAAATASASLVKAPAWEK